MCLMVLASVCIQVQQLADSQNYNNLHHTYSMTAMFSDLCCQRFREIPDGPPFGASLLTEGLAFARNAGGLGNERTSLDLFVL